VFLQAPQDITVGGRLSRGQYQYTLQDANIAELVHRFHGTDHLRRIHATHDGSYPGF
jgi:hypothetical protein